MKFIINIIEIANIIVVVCIFKNRHNTIKITSEKVFNILFIVFVAELSDKLLKCYFIDLESDDFKI